MERTQFYSPTINTRSLLPPAAYFAVLHNFRVTCSNTTPLTVNTPARIHAFVVRLGSPDRYRKFPIANSDDQITTQPATQPSSDVPI